MVVLVDRGWAGLGWLRGVVSTVRGGVSPRGM